MHSHVDVNGNNANTSQRYTREKTDVNISILSSSSPSFLPPVPPNSPSKSPSLSPFHHPFIPSHTRISLLRMLMMICILYMIWITLSTIFIPCSRGMAGLTRRLHSASPSYSSQTLINEYEYLDDDIQVHPTITNCDYPVVTLISSNYCRPTFVLYESLLRAAYRNGYTTCLLIVYVNDKIKATNEFDTSRWTNRSAPWPEDPYCKQMIEHAQQIHITPEGRGVQVSISWWELPPIAFPDWFAVKGTSWAYSMHKIHTFGLPIFSHYRSPDVPTSSLNRTHRIQRQKHQNRFLFLDSDMMFVQHLDRAFQDCHSSYGTGAGVDIHICGVTDQSDGCHTRRGMNGGYLNIHPSKYLHHAFTSCLNERRCSCMSNDYHWSDQELIQCFCNMIGGTTVNPSPIRADIRCRMLPIYNSVWPPQSHCGDVKAGETRAIHFAAYAKPWDEPKKNARLNPWPNHPGRKWLTDPHSLFWACIHDAANQVNEPQKRIQALNACEPTW